jgi:hypothetical protein
MKRIIITNELDNCSEIITVMDVLVFRLTLLLGNICRSSLLIAFHGQMFSAWGKVTSSDYAFCHSCYLVEGLMVNYVEKKISTKLICQKVYFSPSVLTWWKANVTN